MRVRAGKKGFFVHPVIYNLAKKVLILKKNKLNFSWYCENKTFNIRSSFYIRRLRSIVIYAHNGRDLLPSNPHDFIKNKYTFKIGQITYNRHLPEKRTFRAYREVIMQDMKKKRGAVLKIARRRKYTYFKYDGTSS